MHKLAFKKPVKSVVIGCKTEKITQFRGGLPDDWHGIASPNMARPVHEARPFKFRLVIFHDTHDTTYETETAVKRDGTFFMPNEHL